MNTRSFVSYRYHYHYHLSYIVSDLSICSPYGVAVLQFLRRVFTFHAQFRKILLWYSG